MNIARGTTGRRDGASWSPRGGPLAVLVAFPLCLFAAVAGPGGTPAARAATDAGSAFAPVSAGTDAAGVPGTRSTRLDVPVVRQAREKCGEAALTMVLRYYGAEPAALRQVDSAYDPVLRGSLITDLAGAARRAGYTAEIATLTPDSLVALLESGVPPILLYQNGAPPLTVRHFGVVTGWDAAHRAFTLHDGTAQPRDAGLDELAKRWKTAGSQALVVRRRTP